MAKRWTDLEIAFVKANPQMPLKELGKYLGRAKSSINKLRTSLGIYSDFHTPWSDAELQTLAESSHLSNKELAAVLGRTPSQISGARKHRGIRMERTCLMCEGSFTALEAATKVCTGCNPSGIRDKNSPMVRFKHYAEGAAVRGIPFDLTPPQFFAFWQKPCGYCGGPIQTIGLDRLDSSKGYTPDNVAPCCSRCNEMKNNATRAEWIAHMKRVLTFLGEL